jgi:hypothetical protein
MLVPTAAYYLSSTNITTVVRWIEYKVGKVTAYRNLLKEVMICCSLTVIEEIFNKFLS